MNPRTVEAYQILHDGSVALAEVERAGMPVDLEYCKRESRRTLMRAERLKEKIIDSDTGQLWKRIYGPRLNFKSPNQMRNIFFNKLKLEPVGFTETGKPSLDAQALDIMQTRYHLPFVQDFIRMKKLLKIEGTYLRAFERESVNGVVHPFFNLHTVRSYRSCIAEYEEITVVPEGTKSPQQVPIKDVKVGDMVYCMDDDLNPQIKKVLWQGKTGDREVIRVHYYRKGKRGHIDCTPEHRIRMIDGSYVEAQDLMKGDHYKKKSPKERNNRVLACSRARDEVFFTNHLKHGRGMKEYRFLYKKLIGPLKKNEVIHHKDHNHCNNELDNLQKMTKSEHASHHCPETIMSPTSRANNLIAVKKAHKEGSYHPPTGEEHAHYLGLSRQMCLRILARGRGKIKAGADANGTDFDTLKKYLKIHSIDWRIVKLRYDKNGKYISRGRLKKLHPLGRKAVSNLLGHNHYKLIALYEHYGMDTKRKWGNAQGAFAPGNHVITSVEWIKKTVPVYDLEVEDCHNFFVNEILAHNSSNAPNFQQLPLRDPEMGKVVRGAIKAPPGYCIVENDYSGMEVGIGACSHKDRNMVEYITDKSKDMHRDSAMDIFKLSEDQVSKEIRQSIKSGFVFPQFYGSYYVECAKNIYDSVGQLGLKLADGSSLEAHMERVGIGDRGECDPEEKPITGTFEYHVQQMERILWEERFPVFNNWRHEIYDKYKEDLFFDSLTGFRYEGYFRRNEVINFGTQGSAFHCLLKAVIILVGELSQRKMKTRVIGQIHDSIVALVHMDELQFYLDLVYDIMAKRVKKEWKWIIVPLEVDADVTPEAGSWAQKAAWTKDNGIWGPAKKK